MTDGIEIFARANEMTTKKALNIENRSRKQKKTSRRCLLDTKNSTSFRANDCTRPINQFQLRLESAEEKFVGGFAFINNNFRSECEQRE